MSAWRWRTVESADQPCLLGLNSGGIGMAENGSRPVAVVMGVGPGLGASLARRFAEKYAVAINARTPDYLRTLAAEIRSRGGLALEAPGDVGNRDQVADVFKLIRQQVGE